MVSSPRDALRSTQSPFRGGLNGDHRRLLVLAGAFGALILILSAWSALFPLLRLAFGAALLSFAAFPVAVRLESRLSRSASALIGLLSVVALLVGLILFLLPTLLRELGELARALPDVLSELTRRVGAAQSWLENRLPGVSMPRLDPSQATLALSGLASGTITFAGSLLEIGGRVSLAFVLAFFFMRDRDRLLLRLELLLPQAHRAEAVRVGNAVLRDLRLYVKGQLAIAAAVGALSTLALTLLRVRSALALGASIGLLNMIPYFGPFIGGVPAVLIALGEGWQKALMVLAALSLIQQLDGSLISPRVMGSITGFSPALVLIGVFAGAGLCGLTGMLLALPVMLVARTLFRIFIQKCENI